MAKKQLVRLWEWIQYSMDVIHISAHLEIWSMLNCLCTVNCCDLLLMQISVCYVQCYTLLCNNYKLRGHLWAKRTKEAYISKVTMYRLEHLLCNTTWCLFFIFFTILSHFMFNLSWLRSDVDKLGNYRKQSSQGSTKATKGNVTLWVISALYMKTAQSRVALNSLLNWLFKINAVTFLNKDDTFPSPPPIFVQQRKIPTSNCVFNPKPSPHCRRTPKRWAVSPIQSPRSYVRDFSTMHFAAGLSKNDKPKV